MGVNALRCHHFNSHNRVQSMPACRALGAAMVSETATRLELTAVLTAVECVTRANRVSLTMTAQLDWFAE